MADAKKTKLPKHLRPAVYAERRDRRSTFLADSLPTDGTVPPKFARKKRKKSEDIPTAIGGPDAKAAAAKVDFVMGTPIRVRRRQKHFSALKGHLGPVVRLILTKRGKTVKDAANYLGVSQQYLNNRFDRDAPNLEVCYRLGKWLGVTVDALIGLMLKHRAAYRTKLAFAEASRQRNGTCPDKR